MSNAVHDIPRQQDEEVAELKLKTMGIKIDKLSKEQKHYITDYAAGT